MLAKPLRTSVLVALATLVFDASTARAQSMSHANAPIAKPDGDLIRPPTVVELAAAEYPAPAQDAQRQPGVVFRLTLDVEGRVTSAEVVESAEPAFDEAARAALLRSRFAPATRNGRPVAARINFRYEFGSAPVPDTATSSPPPPTPSASAPGAPVPARFTAVPPSPAPNGPQGAAHAPVPRAPMQIMVVGERSRMGELERSAVPVTVINLNRQKKRSADLGEIMARTYGASVRRSGGLGSETRFSLNGLQEDQLRLFVNGFPLDHSFPFGMSSIPVSLLEAVEIYRGVVPVRLASDALGGALNFLTNQSYQTGGTWSYQVGSFGTHRATAAGRYRFSNTGVVIGAETFLDVSKNNYEIDVTVADERGRQQSRRVPRFHDRYTGSGVAVEGGVVDVPWARRLLLRALTTGYDKELQHNIVMTVPYGEATYGETLRGVQARYEHEILPRLDVEVLGSYAHRVIDFKDKSEWIYDWFGRRVRRRVTAGELEDQPSDQTIWQHGVFARAGAAYGLTSSQSLRLATSLDYASRTGDERMQPDPVGRDPLTAERELFKQITGFEHVLNEFPRATPGPKDNEPARGSDHAFQNVFFAKNYVYRVNSEELLPGGVFRARNQRGDRFGLGDGVRVIVTDWLYVKASYELATRLPRSSEVFGDGVLIHANLGLEPEVSSNANLGGRLGVDRSLVGDVTVDLNVFWRETEQQIVLIGTDRYFSFQNLFSARSQGLEGSFEWHFPRRFLAIDGTFSWLEQRNTSEGGPFANFNGARIPNRPWLNASFGARGRIPQLVDPDDELELFYSARYVGEYFRGWESVGQRETKQVTPSQVTHGAGVTYLVRRPFFTVWSTVEAQNFTDARVYDFYGQERPGRSFHLKLTGTL